MSNAWGITTVGNRFRRFEKRDSLDLITKVVLLTSDTTFIESGTDTGRTIEIECPYGTQAIADDLLAKLSGLRYQPYSASGAYVDPRAEIGDGVVFGDPSNLYAGIYSQSLRFGRGMASDIGAPSEDEVNHEYKYVSQPERLFRRSAATLTTQINLLNGRITAYVEETSDALSEHRTDIDQNARDITLRAKSTDGDGTTTASWTLSTSGVVFRHNSTDVLKITQDGLTVNGNGTFRGTVYATAGEIGGCTISNGVLTISSANISSLNVTKLNGQIVSSQIGDGAVIGRTIGSGEVGYSKTAFQSTLDQVFTNKSNIEAIERMFISYLEVTTIGVSANILGKYQNDWQITNLVPADQAVLVWGATTIIGDTLE